MNRFLFHALAAALGYWLASRLIVGVHAGDLISLIIAGVILGVVNALVRPILVILTLPFTLLTLGLFLFVVNGVTVWMVTVFVHGVRIDSLWHAILTAIVITVTSWVAGAVIGSDRR